MRADDAHDGSARLASHGKAARQDVDVVAVLVPEPELALVDRIAALDAFVQQARARHVVGMQQPLPCADVRLDLVFGVAEHLLPARRIHDGARLEVPVPHAFLRADEGEPQPFLALAQRRLGASCAR